MARKVTDLARGENINNVNRRQGRLSVLYTPTPELTIYATGDYGFDDSNINVPIAIAANATGVFVPTYGVRTTTRGIDNRQGFEGGHFALDIGYDLGFGTVRSITGYSGYVSRLGLDLDAQTAALADIYSYTQQNQFSQEFQLTSNGSGPLKYTLGLYYFRENATLNWRNVGGNIINDMRQVTTSKAIYGEASYEVIKGLSVTAGGRYTWDEKNLDTRGTTISTGASLFNFMGINPTWSAFTPKVGVDFKPMANTLLYASWSKGYKSGGFSAVPNVASQAQATFAPEKATTTEIGAKTQFFDNRLRLNAAYFWTDYTDLQLSYRQSGTFFTTTADAKISGFELEAEARPIDMLTLRGSLGTLNANYTKIPINPATGTSFVAGLTLANKLKHVPDLTYRIGGTLAVPISEGNRFELNADYTWTSEIFYAVSNAVSAKSDPYGTLDAQAALVLNDDRIRLTIGAKNLTDEVYFTTAVAGLSRFYAPPRQFYGSVKYRF